MKTELNGKNKIKAINTWAIPLLTYSFGVLNWARTDLESIQRGIRKTMTQFRNHHPVSSVARMTISRKEGGRGLIDIPSLAQRQVSNMRKYFLRRAETTEIHKAVVNMDNKYTPLNLIDPNINIEPETQQARIATWSQKELHGRYRAELNQPYVDKQRSTQWLDTAGLHGETEGFMCAIQDRVIPTRNHQKYIQKLKIPTDKCRKCHIASETIEHVLNGCKVLANTEYMTRHNQAAKIVHQDLALRFGLLDKQHHTTNIIPRLF
jgi:hypothetical protein